MRDGNRISEISEIKRNVIKALYSNPDIIEMLDSPDVDPDCPDTAEFKAIFPYIKIPGTQEEQACYIGVKISIPEYRYLTNDVFVDALLTITVICHVGKMKVQGQKGTRVDIICGDIAEMLNYSRDFGSFTMHLKADVEDNYYENNNYYTRTQKYAIKVSNNTDNGRKRFRSTKSSF